MQKVHYSCKKCGWKTSIRAEWADIKPKRCMTKKCGTSFLATPEALLIELPETLVKVEKKKNEDSSSSKNFKHKVKKHNEGK